MPTRSGRGDGGPREKGWLARSYAKKGRDGRTVWTATYLGVYPTWEEARIAEIDSKIDALTHERNGLLPTIPQQDSLQLIPDGGEGEVVGEQRTVPPE